MTNDKLTPYQSKRDVQQTPFFASRPGTVRGAWETENLPPAAPEAVPRANLGSGRLRGEGK